MTDDLISQKTMLDTAVGISAAVSQKRPVAAHLLDPRQIHLGEHERFVLGGFGDHDPERVADERVTPEFDAGALAAELLEADAVHRGDPAAVRDGVAALDRLPRIELLLAVLRFLRGVPADRGRIKQNVGALQGGEPGALRIPLIPADQGPDRADLRIERAEAQIARRE